MPKEVNILAVAITIDVLENLLAAFREIIVEAESFDEAIIAAHDEMVRRDNA